MASLLDVTVTGEFQVKVEAAAGRRGDIGS
jgi:hypothetical protein